MIVKAENITVEHLKDKDTNKVSGGGIEVTGTGAPNLSVVTGGQDTNATAVNTEFEIAGESKTAEELGFNTDLEKAQVITKDEDKVLDAELHTDLLNQSERDKIADLGVNLSEIIQSIVNSDSGGVLNTYKAHKYGRLLNDFIDKTPKYKDTLGDPNISVEDKQRVLNDAVNNFLTSRGYAGPPLEIFIGDESLSTRGKVVISKDKLNGLSFLEDLGHELGHLVSYDDGKEDTAKIVEGKLGTLEETDTQGKYNDYLESLKEEYKNLKTEEETKEWLANIPDNEKERLVPLVVPALIISSPIVADLAIKYGPIVYQVLSDPVFIESIQFMVINQDLTAEVALRINEAVKNAIQDGDKIEKVEESKESQKETEETQVENDGDKKPDFDKNNLEEQLQEILSKGKLKHIYNNHHIESVAKQAKHMSKEAFLKTYGEKSYFNINWSKEQIGEASNFVCKEAAKKGIINGKYTTTFLNEKITVVINNNTVQTVYGNYKYTYEEILKIGG